VYLYVKNNFNFLLKDKSAKVEFLYNKNDKFFYSEEEQIDCNNNRIQVEVFDNVKNFKFNYFPNTVLIMNSNGLDKLIVYNYNKLSSDTNIQDELSYFIRAVVKHHPNYYQEIHEKSAVYKSVCINEKNYEKLDETSIVNLRNRIQYYYEAGNLDITLYLDDTLHNSRNILSVFVNKQKN
jgi:hypothetical protein